MTRRAMIAPVRRRSADGVAADQDLVAAEAPLSLAVRTSGDTPAHRLGILMRTPGDDEDLVAGVLHAEGVIGRFDDVERLDRTPASDDVAEAITAVLAPHVRWTPRAERGLSATSACGLCGRLEMLAVDPARACPPGAPTITAAAIEALPARLRRGQAVFDETGGLHAAALVDLGGTRDLVREDVGRHNAVDKAIGAALARGWLPGHRFALAVSGRVAYEIVQKAVVAGVPVVVAVGAPSSLAVEAARATGLTLVGFVRDGRFNVYAGWDRVV
ncbi:MAG TPA: formate dehydrogenase accessory sulfurtransferase FdhD [Vicinamibacterales bacterium]|nr:formate dehydrogenase accessory sulfurtransferase FdhD [Vicinamibacterales bacterium]